METESKQSEAKASTSLGWSFWVMVVCTGLIGKFLGLIGVVVFLGIWWLVDYLRKKKK